MEGSCCWGGEDERFDDQFGIVDVMLGDPGEADIDAGFHVRIVLTFVDCMEKRGLI